MSIYLDSANFEDACKAKEFGWVYGVTTNPTLMARAGEKPEVILTKLAALSFHQIYYQLISQSLTAMSEEAEKAHEQVSKGLVLKVAPTEMGFRFVADYGRKFPCCVTAVFSPAQALVAREAGARYIAVYVNRATKQIGDGLGLVSNVAKVLAGSQVEIVAASLKSVEEALAAFVAGAHHLTIPFDVLANLPTHPLSTKTLAQFAEQGVGIALES